jgi:hypothetical protein
LALLGRGLLIVVNDMIPEQYRHVRGQAEALTAAELDALPEAEWIPPNLSDLGRRGRDKCQIPEGGAWGHVRQARWKRIS